MNAISTSVNNNYLTYISLGILLTIILVTGFPHSIHYRHERLNI